MCMPVCHDVERPLDLRRWDWTRNFPRRHSHREQKRAGDRILGWIACSFTLKERPDSNDMVRQKSSKKQRKSLAGHGCCFELAIEECAARGAATCVGMLRYSMTTTRKVKGPVLTTWSEEESLPWNVVDRHSFGKKSRQECRTVLKLGRNTFGLSTHHSNAKKRIKKQK